MSTPPPAPAVSTPDVPPAPAYKPRHIDIGINLTDPVYSGIYHTKPSHPPDIPSILTRSRLTGITHLLITGSDLHCSREALQLTSHSPRLFTTVGVHPCTISSITSSPDPEAHLAELKALAKSSDRVVSFGEIGLDYDRLQYTSVEDQRKWFAKQMDIAEELGLPLFLHMRAAFEDFAAEVFPRIRSGRLPKGGVVHSFTGTMEEMKALVAEGLYVGVNGCSLKTEENLAVVKEIPLERLCVESDGPWCEIRASSAGAQLLKKQGKEMEMPGWPGVKKEKWREDKWVKGRNEPGAVKVVVEIIAAVKGITVEEVAEAAWNNTVKLFNLPEVKEEEAEAERREEAEVVPN